MSKSVVSLISGCFNGEGFIERCFNSVLEQTYVPIEFIFVDDGSTDKTLQRAEAFRKKFEEKGISFILISQKNVGYYPASGIRKASGKYLCTLDVDDILLPASIEKRAVFLETHPNFGGVRTNGYEVSEKTPHHRGKLFVESDEEKNMTNIFEALLLGQTNNWAGSYMVRTDVLFSIYADKFVPMNRFGQNLQILMPVAFQEEIGFIDEPLMKYIRHENSFTMSAIDYETKITQAHEFKKIRESMLTLINVTNERITKDLDEVYFRMFADISYNFKKKEEYNIYYGKLRNKKPVDRLKYLKINDKKFRYFVLILKSKIDRWK